MKQELISKLKTLDTLTAEERAYLIELVNTKKKYGLVWEEKPEEVEEQLRQYLPVFEEVIEKRLGRYRTDGRTDANIEPKQAKLRLQPELFDVKNDTASPPPAAPDTNAKPPVEGESPASGQAQNPENPGPDHFPNHLLIEGDNLHALTALTFTHEGKIDVIYIDPPYNTGNKDFKYNDSFVDREDSYRHSKWLSFMHKRLQLAKRLLSEKGVIFISIDENEVAQLKLLCDDVFTQQNFISLISNINNPKGRSDDKYVARACEFLLVYKNGDLQLSGWEPEEKVLKRYNKFDALGLRYREIDLRKTGDNDRREDRENLFYYFYYHPTTKELIPSKEELDKDGFLKIFPTREDGSEGNWRWEVDNAKRNIHLLIPKFMPVRKK